MFLSCGCFLIWNVNQPPFPLSRTNQLTGEMTKSDVRVVLGPPSEEYGDSWAYSRPLAWPIIFLYFDENGYFRNIEYDY